MFLPPYQLPSCPEGVAKRCWGIRSCRVENENSFFNLGKNIRIGFLIKNNRDLY
jgi:hypothetical protein